MNTTEHHMTRIRSLIEIEMNKLLVSIQTHNISSLLLLASDVHDAKKTVLAHKLVILHSAHEVFGPGPEARPV
jgi:hypothetical protein